MSLNGLDVNAVVEAHHSALADPGGWFLLKYANRDTVEVLSRGNGGVAEAKGAVEQYVEKSPLYGMLQYRRKRVLLKYVPEGTSRLLQVRLTVQFQSILDAFLHDTIFSFTSPAELVESALGLCTMLQPTNPGSLKSSDSSLRQRRLNEISEDAEVLSIPTQREETTFARPETVTDMRMSDNTEMNTLPASALRAKALLAKRKEENQAALQSSTVLLTNPASLSAPLIDKAQPVYVDPPRSLSNLSQLKARDKAESVVSAFKVDNQPIEQQPKQYHHSRHLSENESQSISQWNEQVAAYTLPAAPVPKPKKKLAPRPHVETNTRPKTAHVYDESVSRRPVANLPHSIRVSSRMNGNMTSRPGSQQSSRSVPARFMPTLGLPPPLPDFSPLQVLYMRPASRQGGSVASSNLADNPTASPEKLRLMKALQNRKRSQLLNQRAASAQSSFNRNQDEFPLGGSHLLQPSQTVALPTTIREETMQTSPEAKSAHGSSTASPTSLTNMSENTSTRPSSFAEDHGGRSSGQSASLDTDSSSTPKATADNTRVNHKKHTSWFDSTLDLDEQHQTQVSTTTTRKSPVDEAFVQSRDSRTPTFDDRQTAESTPKPNDRAALSWLANDSDLDVVRPFVPASEGLSQDQSSTPRLLNIDTPAQPGTETPSAMSDDEDTLADGIRGATVHEAKPMFVSRPPQTPTMRTFSVDRTRGVTKSISSLTPKSSRSTPSVLERSPGHSLSSLSTALPQWPPGNDEEPMAVPLTKKSSLGHGISKRIKALEDSSRKDTAVSALPSVHDPAVNRSTISSLIKRTSFISQFQGSNASTEKFSPNETPRRTSSTTPVPSKAMPTRPWSQRKLSGTELHKPKSNVENISTNARSMRSQALGPPNNLATEHTTHLSMLPDVHGSLYENPSTPSSEKKRFSFTSYRSGSSAKWMQSESMASRISLTSKDNKVSKASTSETPSVQEEKRDSRTTRLMKRVSGFGSRFGGKTQQTSTARQEFRPDPIIEQNESHDRESLTESTMQMIDIGNLNVQFPETLLWKRRFLQIDDQGYLIFSAPTESQSVRATSRKFHLGDVQEPCLPDMEREEMAWSVLLDLRDGNCIQCACKSKQEQGTVLKLLLDAHSAYHSLYPDALE